MPKFKPKDELEKLILKRDNVGIVSSIVNGVRLTRPDIWGELETYRLTLSAAMVLAYLGLPKEMIEEAITLTQNKFEEGTEMHDFLFEEFKEGSHSEMDERELDLLNAIKDGSEEVESLLEDEDCYISSEIDDRYIPLINRLDDDVRQYLFNKGVYPRTLVFLLKKLLLLTDGDETIPEEVTSLKDEDRKKMIEQITTALSWIGR